MNRIRAAEILIEKIKKDYIEDVAVVVIMGSTIYGETHHLSDLDLYYVVNTARGYELAKTFIIDGIGYDFWPISWERIERIANYEERITSIVTEGKVLYYGSDEDLKRFNEIKMKALDCSDTLKFIRKSEAVLGNAFKPLFLLNHASTLSQARNLGVQVMFSVTNAIALLNRDMVRRGRGKLKAELLKMEKRPQDFEKLYDVLFESMEVHEIKSSLTELVNQMVQLINREKQNDEMANPVSVKDRLAGFYEELINFYNKIRRSEEIGDTVTAFFAANEINIELCDVFSGTGVALDVLPDLMARYDPNDMEAFYLTARLHQKALESLLANNGVTVTVYNDFEALAEVYA